MESAADKGKSATSRRVASRRTELRLLRLRATGDHTNSIYEHRNTVSTSAECCSLASPREHIRQFLASGCKKFWYRKKRIAAPRMLSGAEGNRNRVKWCLCVGCGWAVAVGVGANWISPFDFFASVRFLVECSSADGEGGQSGDVSFWMQVGKCSWVSI